MRKHGHYGLTLLLALPLIVVLPILYSIPIIGMMLVTSLVPNREVALSILSRRGIVHTVWFAGFLATAIMGSVFALLRLVEIGVLELSGLKPGFLDPAWIAFVFAVGGALGILSHIIGDVLVDGGSKPTLKPFWPISRIPICFALANERDPFANGGLLKLTAPITILLYAIRIGVRPIFLY